MRRAPLVCALALGLGLVAVPFIFGMFDRAPRGAVMLDEFRPFMTDETITTFDGYLAEMDAAEAEAQGDLRAFLAESGVVPDAGFDQEFPLVPSTSKLWETMRGRSTKLSWSTGNASSGPTRITPDPRRV